MLLNGIGPAWVEGVTLEQPARCPTQSHNDTVPPDRLAGITGAGGVKSAGRRKQRRDPSLIERDQTEAELSHRRSVRRTNNPSCRSAESQRSRSCVSEARA